MPAFCFASPLATSRTPLHPPVSACTPPTSHPSSAGRRWSATPTGATMPCWPGASRRASTSPATAPWAHPTAPPYSSGLPPRLCPACCTHPAARSQAHLPKNIPPPPPPSAVRPPTAGARPQSCWRTPRSWQLLRSWANLQHRCGPWGQQLAARASSACSVTCRPRRAVCALCLSHLRRLPALRAMLDAALSAPAAVDVGCITYHVAPARSPRLPVCLQVLIRWGLQRGTSVLPKSVNKERLQVGAVSSSVRWPSLAAMGRGQAGSSCR